MRSRPTVSALSSSGTDPAAAADAMLRRLRLHFQEIDDLTAQLMDVKIRQMDGALALALLANPEAMPQRRGTPIMTRDEALDVLVSTREEKARLMSRIRDVALRVRGVVKELVSDEENEDDGSVQQQRGTGTGPGFRVGRGGGAMMGFDFGLGPQGDGLGGVRSLLLG